MAKKVFFILVIGIFLIPPSTEVFGLSCAPPDIAKSFEESNVVFAGEVVSKEYLEPSDEHTLIAKSLFLVKEPFKGVFQEHLTVSSNEKFWGINYTEGLEYLVFADYVGSEIQSQLCDPTSLLEFSNIDLVRSISEKNILPPLKQTSLGVAAENIQCKENLVLVLRINGSPACVKETTADKLDWEIIETDFSAIKGKSDSKVNSNLSDSSIEYSELVDANNEFAFEFYSQIKENNENVFFSPWSIMTAFAIVNEGAQGFTAEEMQNVFGFSSDQTQRQKEFKYANDKLNQQDSSYSLQVANALWLAEKTKLINEYVTIAANYYDSEVSTVDFVSDDGVDQINSWVSEKTQNKIKNILEPGSTSDLTRLVITNAIYFKGAWVTQFDEENTQDQDFVIDSETTVKTPMMNLYQSQQVYGETDEIKILELPYEGDKLSMFFLLPKEVNEINKLENSLSVDNLNQWRESLAPHQVETVSIPKFELETDYDLIPPLEKLGLSAAFDPQNANFSGISDSEQLLITGALHKAYVDVNEEGTEAAAATGITVGVTSAPIDPPPVFTFIADHPFIFVIQDNEAGNILFIGKMANPSE